jgi:hypothetical protein
LFRIIIVIAFALSALLTTAFTAMKLTGAIQWSWMWVLAPTWIALALGLLLLLPILVALRIIFREGRNIP